MAGDKKALIKETLSFLIFPPERRVSVGDGELDGVLLTRELRNGAGGGASGQVNMRLALHLAEVSMLDICHCTCSRP